MVPKTRQVRRGAIASSVSDAQDGSNGGGDGSSHAWQKKLVPKSEETRGRLEAALRNNVMFAHLDEEQRRDVFDAMFECNFDPGKDIIKQGDEGDNFYVIESGQCDIFVSSAPNSEPVKVLTLTDAGSFGELALIYGAPRAATVRATRKTRCWALDRSTYRHIMMDSTISKRKLYESFLEQVELLSSLNKYERLTVADALRPCSFEDGDVIVRQGDPGDEFFIVEKGNVTVRRWFQQPSDEREVLHLGPGQYFGEIALLTSKPRAATCIAHGKVKCVKLDRQAFIRVLGPCEEILRRNMVVYEKYVLA